MPDFVKEGEMVEPQESKNSDQSADNLKENLESFGTAEDSEEPPRKTLHDQLKEHRDKKQLEFEQQMAIRNSSFKLDEESAKFYEKLHNEALEKERKQRKEEQEKLALYKQKKVSRKESGTHQNGQDESNRKRALADLTPSIPKKIALSKKSEPIASKGVVGLGDYSSDSDSESD